VAADPRVDAIDDRRGHGLLGGARGQRREDVVAQLPDLVETLRHRVGRTAAIRSPFNVPIALAAAAVASRVLGASHGSARRLDLGGTLLGASGLAAIIAAFTLAAQDGLTAAGAWIPMLAGVGALTAFVAMQARHEAPLAPLPVLRRAAIAGPASVAALLTASSQLAPPPAVAPVRARRRGIAWRARCDRGARATAGAAAPSPPASMPAGSPPPRSPPPAQSRSSARRMAVGCAR